MHLSLNKQLEPRPEVKMTELLFVQMELNIFRNDLNMNGLWILEQICCDNE